LATKEINIHTYIQNS